MWTVEAIKRASLAATVVVAATPGETLYVEVGGTGGFPAGGFNGGGAGATRNRISVYGGGGASDVHMEVGALPMCAWCPTTSRGSLGSRVIVAGGGGGSAYPAARGGAAGEPGGSSPGSSVGGGAGTEYGGRGRGCDALGVGCGTDGSLGVGGAGGGSGFKLLIK